MPQRFQGFSGVLNINALQAFWPKWFCTGQTNIHEYHCHICPIHPVLNLIFLTEYPRTGFRIQYLYVSLSTQTLGYSFPSLVSLIADSSEKSFPWADEPWLQQGRILVCSTWCQHDGQIHLWGFMNKLGFSRVHSSALPANIKTF